VLELRNDRSVICNGRDVDPDYDPEHDFENDPLDRQCDPSVVANYKKFMHGRKYFLYFPDFEGIFVFSFV